MAPGGQRRLRRVACPHDDDVASSDERALRTNGPSSALGKLGCDSTVPWQCDPHFPPASSAPACVPRRPGRDFAQCRLPLRTTCGTWTPSWTRGRPQPQQPASANGSLWAQGATFRSCATPAALRLTPQPPPRPTTSQGDDPLLAFLDAPSQLCGCAAGCSCGCMDWLEELPSSPRGAAPAPAFPRPPISQAMLPVPVRVARPQSAASLVLTPPPSLAARTHRTAALPGQRPPAGVCCVRPGACTR